MMRPLLVLALYIVAVAVLGALLAPVFWHVLQLVVDQPWLPQSVAGAGFQRVANRAFMVVALVLLPVMLLAMKLRGRAAWGIDLAPRQAGRALLLGLAFGLATMLALVILQGALGMRFWDDDATVGTVAVAALTGLVSGVVIGAIEELFFRGGIYAACERDFGAGVAIGITAVIYAAVHFVAAKGDLGPIDTWSGFRQLRLAFDTAWQAAKIGPFLTLVGVGVFLGLLRRRLGHVVAGMGVHAGWVMAIRLGRESSDLTPGHHLAFLAPDAKAGGYDGVTGYLAAAYMLLLIVALLLWPRRPAAASPAPTAAQAAP